MNVTQFGIDWALLREQKTWLLQQENSDLAEGLIHLLDALQDQAVSEGLDAQEVFGIDTLVD